MPHITHDLVRLASSLPQQPDSDGQIRRCPACGAPVRLVGIVTVVEDGSAARCTVYRCTSPPCSLRIADLDDRI